MTKVVRRGLHTYGYLLIIATIITVFAALTTIGVSAVEFETAPYTYNGESGVTIIGFNGLSDGEKVTIPATIEGKKVLAIGLDGVVTTMSIPGAEKISALDLSNTGVKVILPFAFFWCSNITGTIESKTVEVIRDNAFYGCEGLTSLDLTALETVNNYAFNTCTSITSFSASKLKIIGQSAFSCCYNLESVDTPNCEEVGNWAFTYCANLAHIDLSACKIVGDAAFEDLTKLTSVVMPQCEKINYRAFLNCENLVITIPLNCDIGYGALNNVKEVKVANSFVELSDYNSGEISKGGLFNGQISKEGISIYIDQSLNDVPYHLTYNVSENMSYNKNDYITEAAYNILIESIVNEYGDPIALNQNATITLSIPEDRYNPNKAYFICKNNEKPIKIKLNQDGVYEYSFDEYIGGSLKMTVALMSSDVKFETEQTWFVGGLGKINGVAITSIKNVPDNGMIIIPNKIGNEPVLALGNGDTSLLSTTNEENDLVYLDLSQAGMLIKIEDRAFNNNINLKSVTSNSVELIGYCAFSNCESLESAYFPHCSKVDDLAFFFCENLKSITLLSGCWTDTHAFYFVHPECTIKK